MRCRLLTLNLWNVNEPLEARMEDLAAWLRRERPDLVALQEVSVADGRSQAAVLAEAAGYPFRHYDRVWRSRRREEGLAVLSRLEFAARVPLPLPEAPGDGPRILQQVDVAGDGRDLRLGNTHLAWRPSSEPGRVAQARRIAAVLGEVAAPRVLVGDLNDEPGSATLSALLEGGFRDGYRSGGGSDGPTFAAANPWTWRVTLFDRRIDHVLVDDRVAVTDARIVLTGDDAPAVSDHYGIVVTLEW